MSFAKKISVLISFLSDLNHLLSMIGLTHCVVFFQSYIGVYEAQMISFESNAPFRQ